MSLSSYRSDVSRVRNDIADINKKISEESSKEANLIRKQHDIHSSMTGNVSPSTMASKLRDLERVISDLSRVQSSKSDLQKRLASKEADLSRNLDRLSREETSERRKEEAIRKKIDEQEKRRRSEQEAYSRSLSNRMRDIQMMNPSLLPASQMKTTKEYDFFVSHASEDKEDFVESLANALIGKGASVWYDDTVLKVGDSLRREIDKGLANSKFGVVVLSAFFFRKEWPQKELDGLVSLETSGEKRILPIWHKISKDEVSKYSPTMADRVALNSSIKTAEEIAIELVSLLPKREE